MNFDIDFHGSARLGRMATGIQGGGSLGEYAESMRRHLGCQAVAMRIADPFGPLLAAPDRARTGQESVPCAKSLAICACTSDAKRPPLSSAALADPARLTDPVAVCEMGFGFYAGLPLRLASGVNIGMLAAIDRGPRRLARNELATLRLLADVVVRIIEFRLALGGHNNGGALGSA